MDNTPDNKPNGFSFKNEDANTRRERAIISRYTSSIELQCNRMAYKSMIGWRN